MRFSAADNEVTDDDVDARAARALRPAPVRHQRADAHGQRVPRRVRGPVLQGAARAARCSWASAARRRETCFCNAWGTDEVHWGFDIFLTDLGDRYFVSVRSVKGAELLDRYVETRDITDEDTAEFQRSDARSSRTSFASDRRHRAAAAAARREVRRARSGTSSASKCLSCGACSMVCPTCYCFDVKDRLDAGRRERRARPRVGLAASSRSSPRSPTVTTSARRARAG